MSWPALWAVVFWGFSFIATKVALREVHPFTLLALRFGIGGFLLLLAQLQRDRGFLSTFSSRDWVSIIFLAIVGICGNTLLQAYGLLYTSAIHTGWMVAVVPIFIHRSPFLFRGGRHPEEGWRDTPWFHWSFFGCFKRCVLAFHLPFGLDVW